jgi:peptidoglycan/LPS O-acetylase OafA/YrhL
MFLPSWRTIFLSAFNLPFIAGVLAYAWFRRIERIPLLPLAAAVPVALAAVERLATTQAQIAMLALAFGSLVLAAAELSRRRDASAGNLLVRLGDWSYGLYLVHVPIVRAAALAFAAMSLAPNLAFVVAVALALAGGLAFGAVEMTVYRRNKRWLDPKTGVRPDSDRGLTPV